MNQMKHWKRVLAVICGAVFFAGCSKEKEDGRDTEYPTIDVTAAAAFPRQCSELTRGQKFTAKILVADNASLGSVGIDVHHNFDHHSHSTEVNICAMDPAKIPVKPLLLIKSIPIPAGSRSYTATAEIEIPADTDTGDYHFMIKVTDREGWQTIKGLSIKIK